MSGYPTQHSPYIPKISRECVAGSHKKKNKRTILKDRERGKSLQGGRGEHQSRMRILLWYSPCYVITGPKKFYTKEERENPEGSKELLIRKGTHVRKREQNGVTFKTVPPTHLIGSSAVFPS